MLSWLVRGIIGIALVNLLALLALHVAYGWHHWLKPMREHRRARQRSFERLLAGPMSANRVALPERDEPLESYHVVAERTDPS